MALLKALASRAHVARAITLQSGAEHEPAIGLPRGQNRRLSLHPARHEGVAQRFAACGFDDTDRLMPPATSARSAFGSGKVTRP